jgi:putative membrane protein
MGVDAAYPSWHPHLDTWLLVIALAAAYAVTVARVGPRHAAPGRPPVTKLQAVCFSLGVAAVWVASDWPVHDIAEELNYSMHMVQHLVLSMVAAPLLLLGTPAWMLRAILRPPSRLFGAVRFLSRFLPALIVFNVVLVLTH